MSFRHPQASLPHARTISLGRMVGLTCRAVAAFCALDRVASAVGAVGGPLVPRGGPVVSYAIARLRDHCGTTQLVDLVVLVCGHNAIIRTVFRRECDARRARGTPGEPWLAMVWGWPLLDVRRSAFRPTHSIRRESGPGSSSTNSSLVGNEAIPKAPRQPLPTRGTVRI